MNIEIVTCLIILWTVLFDSLRDGFLHNVSWTKWHIIKYCEFYPIIIYLMILTLHKWYIWIVLPIISWAIWRFGITVICKKHWETIWVRLFRKLFNAKK